MTKIKHADKLTAKISCITTYGLSEKYSLLTEIKWRKNMKKTKLIALVLCMALICGLLVGCGARR